MKAPLIGRKYTWTSFEIGSFLIALVGDTPPNCPHKLTKTAGPVARRRAASGGANCTRASRRLPVRSCSSLVAAAVVPLTGAGV